MDRLNVLYDERLDDSDGEEELNVRYLLIGFEIINDLIQKEIAAAAPCAVPCS
ncbi:MAG: hypothetical protein LBD47_11095 [Treponema sp.]|nr:hypothetical protein [Treponema sp.]